jgi:hypothetical protein
MPHNKEIEEKVKEYLDFCKSKGIKTGYHQAIETTIVSDWWIEALTSYGKSQYDKGVEEERKEWLKGNRCSACGDSNLESGGLSDVCNNCVEDQ